MLRFLTPNSHVSSLVEVIVRTAVHHAAPAEAVGRQEGISVCEQNICKNDKPFVACCRKIECCVVCHCFCVELLFAVPYPSLTWSRNHNLPTSIHLPYCAKSL